MQDINDIITNQLRADLGSVLTVNQIVATLQSVTNGSGSSRSVTRLEVSNVMTERQDSNKLSKYSVIKKFLNNVSPDFRSVVYITTDIGTTFNTVTGLYDLDIPPLWNAHPEVLNNFPGWLSDNQVIILILDIDLASCSFTEVDVATLLECPNAGGYNIVWYFAQEVFPNEFTTMINNSVSYTSQCGNSTTGSISSTDIFTGLQAILNNINGGPTSTLITTKCSVGELGSTESLINMNPTTKAAIGVSGQWRLADAVPLVSVHLGDEVFTV